MKKHVKVYLTEMGLVIFEVILCEVCGRVAVDIHHVVFKSQGGKDVIENLIALCRQCHDKAHFKTKPFLTEEELLEIINNR